MTRYLVVAAIVGVVAGVFWVLSRTLSSDAVAMSLGVMFGILAGIPTALLAMASGNDARRREAEREVERLQDELGRQRADRIMIIDGQLNDPAQRLPARRNHTSPR